MLQRRALHSLPALTWWLGIPRRAIPEELHGFARFLVFLIVLCAAVYLYVQTASHISSVRLRITDLQAEYARLQRENAELVRQMATYTDIRRVEARARELGYQPPESQMFVRVKITAKDPLAKGSAGADVPLTRPWWQAVLDWATVKLNPSAYAQAEH